MAGSGGGIKFSSNLAQLGPEEQHTNPDVLIQFLENFLHTMNSVNREKITLCSQDIYFFNYYIKKAYCDQIHWDTQWIHLPCKTLQSSAGPRGVT